METTTILEDIENQISYLRQSLVLCNGFKEKCQQLENENKGLSVRCTDLQAQLEILKKKECGDCKILKKRLIQERKERENLKIEEKARLLKTIAKALGSIDDGNSNQMTNAHQLFTQLVSGQFDKTDEVEEKKSISLVGDNESSEDEASSEVLANETVVAINNEDSLNDCGARFSLPLVVPETELIDIVLPGYNKNISNNKENEVNELRKRVYRDNIKKDALCVEEENEIQPTLKKLKSVPPLCKVTEEVSLIVDDQLHRTLCPLRISSTDGLMPIVDSTPAKSPSILSEKIEINSGSSNGWLKTGINDTQDDRNSVWKMKPSVVIENKVPAINGKKLKQMTLSLTHLEKKHDISLSGRFKGGTVNDITKLKSNENDLIIPSPEGGAQQFSHRKYEYETLDDPDMTVFNPGITSTCLPTLAETSFDRLPQSMKSPSYRYRRDTVRKRDERMKLPGQDCDDCARYYKAASLNKSQEVRSRMSACSRHRDKYKIRANTPPGFWDPVMSSSP